MNASVDTAAANHSAPHRASNGPKCARATRANRVAEATVVAARASAGVSSHPMGGANTL